jgi:hypothetical protein
MAHYFPSHLLFHIVHLRKWKHIKVLTYQHIWLRNFYLDYA